MPKRDRPQIEFIARGLLTDSSRALLCRNVANAYYFLPGGHVEFGENAAGALARELEEETGLTAEVGAPLLLSEHIYERASGRRHHELLLVFHVERLLDAEGVPTAGVQSREKKIAFEWVELAAIPELDVRPPRHKAWLAAGGAGGGPVVSWASDTLTSSLPPDETE
ncbi:MAG: NUDIX domain-containing protein [Phycisphaerales bacterium]